jgi:hypothetical protein
MIDYAILAALITALARISHTTFTKPNDIAQGFFSLPIGKRHRGA